MGSANRYCTLLSWIELYPEAREVKRSRIGILPYTLSAPCSLLNALKPKLRKRKRKQATISPELVADHFPSTSVSRSSAILVAASWILGRKRNADQQTSIFVPKVYSSENFRY